VKITDSEVLYGILLVNHLTRQVTHLRRKYL
jgi:hypothetical protein